MAGTLRRDTVPFQHYRDGVHRNADDILPSRSRGERGLLEACAIKAVYGRVRLWSGREQRRN